jgi:hypothetical protein
MRWREVLRVASGAFGVEEAVIVGTQPVGDPVDQDLGERLDQRLVSPENRYVGRWLPTRKDRGFEKCPYLTEARGPKVAP